MRKLFLVITTIFIGLLTLPVTAQEPAEELNSDLGKNIIIGQNAFYLTLTRDTQSPDTKHVTYHLKIVPNISSDRVEIEWAMVGASELVTPIKKKNLVVEKGVAVTETFTIKPRVFGKTEVRAEVRAVAAANDYTVAARDEFASNNEGEIIPLSPDYQQAKTIFQIKQVVTIVAIIAIIAGIGYLAYRRFKKWLASGNQPM
jgi:hypothetical protein